MRELTERLKPKNRKIMTGSSKYISRSAADTKEYARKIGAAAAGGEVIALYGGLGAGKTVFAKGFADGLGIKDSVVSPTFAIMREYRGRLRLCHFDMYRLDESGARELGLFEFFGLKDTVCLIEWPENIGGGLPQGARKIRIAPTDDGGDTREIEPIEEQ
jgi:tRNA threonylcarbamoyladenosine biosynthesis protein TsaE